MAADETASADDRAARASRDEAEAANVALERTRRLAQAEAALATAPAKAESSHVDGSTVTWATYDLLVGHEDAAQSASDDHLDGAWARLDGKALEPALLPVGDLPPPVLLLDARYLIALARKGGLLSPRHELPPRAFVDVARLKRMRGGGAGGFCLRVIGVSMPWLTTRHPDPKGLHLQKLSRVIDCFVKDRS